MPRSKSRKKSYPWIVVVLLGVVLIAAFFTVRAEFFSGRTSTAENPHELSPQQAQSELAKGVLLLDVREKDEYTRSHIAASLWVPLGNLSSWVQNLPQDRLIIVVCQDGVRAARGRDFLIANGFSNVKSLSGGIDAWVAAGYPVESGLPAN